MALARNIEKSVLSYRLPRLKTFTVCYPIRGPRWTVCLKILYLFSSIKFEFGIDNTVGGRITFAAGVDFTIFGKRLYLRMNINLRDPSAAIKSTASKGVDTYKEKGNPKSKTDTDERVYDDPNPFSDFELSGKC